MIGDGEYGGVGASSAGDCDCDMGTPTWWDTKWFWRLWWSMLSLRERKLGGGVCCVAASCPCSLEDRDSCSCSSSSMSRISPGPTEAVLRLGTWCHCEPDGPVDGSPARKNTVVALKISCSSVTSILREPKPEYVEGSKRNRWNTRRREEEN